MTLIPTHLIGLTEDEARASIAEHGDPSHCSFKGCRETQLAIILIIKKPGSGWGENISSACACQEHAAGLQQILDEVVHHD